MAVYALTFTEHHPLKTVLVKNMHFGNFDEVSHNEAETQLWLPPWFIFGHWRPI